MPTGPSNVMLKSFRKKLNSGLLSTTLPSVQQRCLLCGKLLRQILLPYAKLFQFQLCVPLGPWTNCSSMQWKYSQWNNVLYVENVTHGTTLGKCCVAHHFDQSAPDDSIHLFDLSKPDWHAAQDQLRPHLLRYLKKLSLPLLMHPNFGLPFQSHLQPIRDGQKTSTSQTLPAILCYLPQVQCGNEHSTTHAKSKVD